MTATTDSVFSGTLAEFFEFSSGFLHNMKGVEKLTREARAMIVQMLDDPRFSDETRASMPKLETYSIGEMSRWWSDVPVWILGLSYEERGILATTEVRFS